MFDTVLVANRGEIAVRVIRTLRDLGVRSVAVFSDADADAPHVRAADIAVRLGPAAAGESYLAIERVIDAAKQTGAQAIHPGYGFLAENAAFARACEHAGVVFIGPPPSAIEAMGDKIRAKQTVQAAGVPVVPGRTESGMTDDELVDAAAEVGFPVLLKPSAGGGGKGMRKVDDPAELRTQIVSARREALGSFGDDTLLVERFVERPRHIEIQVLADGHGNVVHLGERECSLQRRHQKIIEEAPSPLLDEETRARMGAAAVDAAKSVGYTGAGTIEFIVSSSRVDDFFFMEMNTRLQVEHPVTELITAIGPTRGIDLVEWQLRVAAGEPLPFAQQDIVLDGHAIEARVYAEDPARDFLPTGGRVLALREPTSAARSGAMPDVRVDSGLAVGLDIATIYDPMLAKVIAWGPDRAAALRRLDGALADTALLGVRTNISFLRALLADPDVAAGRLDTGLVERRHDELVAAVVPDEVLVAAALQRLIDLEPTGSASAWDIPGGWRIGEPAWTTWRIEVAGREPAAVRVRGRAVAAEVVIDDGQAESASARHVDGLLVIDYAGRTSRFHSAKDGAVHWLGRDGHAWALTETDPLAAARTNAGQTGASAITSPMPGTVLAVHIEQGSEVTAGQALLVVEAMKMEHTITAPADGVVSELHVHAGQQVKLDQPLALVTPHSQD